MYYIYRITNNITGETYIGRHKYKRARDDYFGSGKLLKDAIRKHGKKNFTKDILVKRIPTLESADYAERLYISRERANGGSQYNITGGGSGFLAHHKKESREKISASLVGNQRAKGHAIGNQYAKGNILSADVRRRMGESRKGNTNNGATFIRCIETGEIHRTREWLLLGYQNAYSVAYGYQKTCKGYHFELVG